MATLAPIVLGEETIEDRSLLFDDAFPQDTDGRRYLRNITVPTLTPYLPDPATATGTGVVIAPGGALLFLSIDHEGAWFAERLIDRGIAAFVLHHRLVPTPAETAEFVATVERWVTEPAYASDILETSRASAAQDGGSAVRLVRECAREWGVDPDRIGMLGFSSGGFVAVVTALDTEPVARPSFVAPIYPVFWGGLVVPSPAPPMFLAWATDDEFGDLVLGPALRLYDSWRRAGASVEAHAYATGGHNFATTKPETASNRWIDDFCAWLDASGF